MFGDGKWAPYSREEIATVRRLAGDGLNDSQIEAKTGIPARRVKGIRHKNRIESPYLGNRKATYRKILTPAELAYLRRAVGFRPGYDYAKDEDGHGTRGAVAA